MPKIDLIIYVFRKNVTSAPGDLLEFGKKSLIVPHFVVPDIAGIGLISLILDFQFGVYDLMV